MVIALGNVVALCLAGSDPRPALVVGVAALPERADPVLSLAAALRVSDTEANVVTYQQVLGPNDGADAPIHWDVAGTELLGGTPLENVVPGSPPVSPPGGGHPESESVNESGGGGAGA